MHIVQAGAVFEVSSIPESSFLENHRAVGLPFNTYSLADSRLSRVKWLPILLQHSKGLSVLDCDLPLSAFAEVKGRFDLAAELVRRFFRQDADLLRPDQDAHPLALLDTIGSGTDLRAGYADRG